MEELHKRVIKRSGEEVDFDLHKIVNAINAANEETDKLHQMNPYQIKAVAENVADKIAGMTHAIHVEDIQDIVETSIMEMRGYEVAQKYVRYRYKRELSRKSNTTDNGILALIDQLNEEGQTKALEYVEDLVLTGRYKKADAHGVAAKEA